MALATLVRFTLLLISLAVLTEVKDVSDESKFFRADKLLEVVCLQPMTTTTCCAVS